MFKFSVVKKLHGARLTELVTPHGSIQGPFFQFVATQAAVRGQVYSEDLERLGVQIVLANTYHLHIRPGADIVADAGGLHDFMQWSGPMTTDSGGYQVFSLSEGQALDEDGVTFRSPLDGKRHRLTPESAIAIQQQLGADIIMPLDIATAFNASRAEIEAAVAQTVRWAKRCREALVHNAGESRAASAQGSGEPKAASAQGYGEPRAASAQGYGEPKQVLYGIVQGGLHPDLREQCAQALREIDFFGYSIGGELRDAGATRMEEGVAMTVPHLPSEAPRYLMGAGTPDDIVRTVRLGIDQFDTVLPIRNARHGKLYSALNREELERCLVDPERPVVADELYTTIDIRKARHARRWEPFGDRNPATGKPYTWGYLHHLMRAEPPSGYRLAVLHNIYFYVQLMQALREIIAARGD